MFADAVAHDFASQAYINPCALDFVWVEQALYTHVQRAVQRALLERMLQKMFVGNGLKAGDPWEIMRIRRGIAITNFSHSS